jgi:hypothetical protein
MAKYKKPIEEKIKYLSNFSDVNYPFISVYLNINSHENLFEQAEINRIFLKDSFRKNFDVLKKEHNRNKLGSFQNDGDKILEFINNKLDSKMHGAAIFACDGLGVFETFQSLMPFDNALFVNSFPHLKQLVYQAEENENALIALLDSKSAKIFTLKLGGFIVTEQEITNNVHRYHKQGGWAQARYQRHIKDEMHKHYIETAKALTALFDEEKYENIIILGEENEIKNFEENLPKRLIEKVITENSLYMRENINRIMEIILKELKINAKKRELTIVQDLISFAQSGGPETLGIQDTIQLAKEGRIDTLTSVKDYSLGGWQCDSCYYVDKTQYQAGCPKCNGNMKEIDLVEEAIRLTLKNGGEVNLVEDEAAEELKKHESIGAYLRYA